MEDPPLGFRFEDVDSGMLGGCVEAVPWCEGYFHSRGPEVWRGRAADELIDVEGDDAVIRALRWWGHRWDGSGVPVVFLGLEGV